MSVERTFVFGEMTQVSHFLPKEQPGALCARREESAPFSTKVFAARRPSVGRAVWPRRERSPEASERGGRRPLGEASMAGPGTVRALAGHCVVTGVF